jgi:amino acid transporter
MSMQSKTRKTLYLVLTIIGTLAPMIMVSFFLLEQGLTPLQLMDQIFSSLLSVALFVNIIVGCVTLSVLMKTEGHEFGVKTWPPMVAMSLVGISSALPLYFYLRESRIAINEDNDQ